MCFRVGSIYVFRCERPIGVGADLTAMADYVRVLMERYRRFGTFATAEQFDELMGSCRKAIAFYESGLSRSSAAR